MNSRSHQIRFWSRENPNFHQDIHQHPDHLMIWAALSEKHLIGPYYFNGSVNQQSYYDMIENWFLPEVAARELEHTIYFQQNGAPAHFVLSVRSLLNECLSEWIGRGSDFLEFPARSPDRTTCENSLWGIIKEKVSKIRTRT